MDFSDRGPQRDNRGLIEGIIASAAVLLAMVAVIVEGISSPGCSLCVEKTWSSFLDVVIGAAFVAGGLLIRSRQPSHPLWWFMTIAGLGRFLEEIFGTLGGSLFPVWYISRQVFLIAVIWTCALYFPVGTLTRVDRWLLVHWYSWAIVAGIIRLVYAAPHSLLPGAAIAPKPGSASWVEALLPATTAWADIGLIASIVVLLHRWWVGNAYVRKAFIPLFFFVPFLLFNAIDNWLVGFGLDVGLLRVSTWTDYLLAAAIPFTFVNGVLGWPPWRVAVDAQPTRQLTTVLFVDIVDSSGHAGQLGDHRWTALLAQFRDVVREGVRARGGTEENTSGDGMLMTFPTPAAALACASDLTLSVAELGLELRVGIHTGEINRHQNELSGLAIHVGARVMSSAGPSQVLVTQIVHDLVAADGYSFTDAGTIPLRGIPGDWHVWSLNHRAPHSTN